MIRRQAIRPIKSNSPRALSWALRIMHRFDRFDQTDRLNLLLCVPSVARTLMLLQQRFTSFINLEPRLALSVNPTSVVNSWSNFIAPRQTLLKVLAMTDTAKRAGSVESETLLRKQAPQNFDVLYRTRQIRELENRRRLSLTLAINRRSTDLSSTFSQKFLVQRESQFREVSTLLTQRTKRISEPSVMQVPMALRAAPTNRGVRPEVVAEVLRQRDVFESRNGPTNVSQVQQPALNVELLAAQVMKQIDRRVIARRERMGQI